jgi:4-hydroxymandelate synthase
MDVTAVDHIEFYVNDPEETAAHLCAAFGFDRRGQGGPETGLPDRRSILIGQGAIRLLLTCGLNQTHPAVEHVRRHGDGAGCIALRTTDAGQAFEQAVRAGAQAVAMPRTWPDADGGLTTAAVSGPGDLTIQLIERREPTGEFMPGIVERIESPRQPDGDPLQTIDHIALCVGAADLRPTVAAFQRSFHLDQIFQERIEVSDQAMDSTVVQSPSRGVTFTIIAPDPTTRPGQIDDFLRSNAGPGVQHLALSTADIVTAVAAFGERGMRFLSTPASYYDAIGRRLGAVDLSVDALRAGNILVDRDHHGELFQIFTESTVARRTFFFELIERHGALTFGSNNVKALYEAKERERIDVSVRP